MRTEAQPREVGGMHDGYRALVVEDDSDLRAVLEEVLAQSGLAVTSTPSGMEALELMPRLAPDLVTLDLSLPDMDGVEICRRLRQFTDAYVIMLTGRTEEVDRLIGLEVGADDFMIKPFSPRELRARVGAMFRRPRTRPVVPAQATESRDDTDDAIGAGAGLVVLPSRREVRLHDEEVALTRTEFDLLLALVSRPGRVWERQALVREVWDGDWFDSGHLVDVHIANLRRKLGRADDAPKWIHTVRGVGFRFDRA